jgi:hypothetical protein
MPAYAHLCLALLVPSAGLIAAAIYLDIRRGHAAFVRLAGVRESQKSEGGSHRAK